MSKQPKIYPEKVKWDQEISPKPVFALLDEAVKNFPGVQAIDFLGNCLSYKQLQDEVNSLTQAFKKLGVKKGVKVGLYLPNCPSFVISYYSVLKAGGTVVNFSPLYSEPELKHQLEDSETEILITLDLELLYPKAKALLKESQKNKGKYQKLLVTRMCNELPSVKGFLFNILKRKQLSKVSYGNGVECLKKIINDYKNLNSDNINVKGEDEEDIDVNNTAIIQYTGGTTGTPKGAELSHSNVYINAIQCRRWCTNFEDGKEKFLIVLPLFHVFSMTAGMNLAISCGSGMILHPRFEIKKVLKDLQKKKATAMPGVPTMYNAINNCKDTPKFDLKSLKTCVSGGAALPVEVKKKFEEITGCTLIEGYGLTETSPVACCNPVVGENKAGSIGLPFPNTEILIEDTENKGNFLGVEERGELCIKGPQVMKGYYNKPDETKEVMVKDGVFRTGDVAKVDEDGYVYIVDRLKEMIICGGFKVYPRHVEEIIYEHPNILECAVIGTADDYSGERVKAFIVFKENKEISKDELMSFFKEKLAKHEVPRVIEVIDELPKSPIGKILKKELK